MTQRERQAVGGWPAAERIPTAAHDARHGDSAPRWAELFPALPPAQQRLLLTLAADQGVLNARQIPAPNGAADPARAFFGPLFGGRGVDSLPAVALSPIDPVDAALTEEQRTAVAKALHTPDVCLIRGLPGTGKSRVIAEIIRQAARRGLRVLLAAPTPAALDVVLDRLADDSHVLPLRCPGDEKPEALSPTAARATVAAYARQLGDEAVACARRAADEADARRIRLEADAVILTALAVQADRISAISPALADVEARLAGLEADVPADPGVGATERAAHDAALAELDAALARADADVQKAAGDLAAATAMLDKLLPLADDRQHLRLLSRNFWRSFSESDLTRRIDEARARQSDLQKRWADAKDARDRVTDQRTRELADWSARRQVLIAEENRRRRAEYADRRAALEKERDELVGEWNRAVRDLPRGHELRKVTPSVQEMPVAVAAVRVPLDRDLESARREAEFTRCWADTLAEHAADLPARLLTHVNLIAATVSPQSADDPIAEAARRGPFDLLILDEAHRLTDAEFYPVARRAARWVLVGEPVPDAPKTAAGSAGVEHDDRGRRGGPTVHARPRQKAAAKVLALPRLWQSLHCETWRTESGRVRCQLRPLAPHDRARIETESVADDPDIELHILAPETGSPALVEVVFPPAMPVDRAKAYLYRELNELPVPAAPARWDETPQRWVYRIAGAPATRSVELEPGLRELFHECGDRWHTVAFEFDRATWPRERAEAWAAQQLRTHDPARTADLATPHRMRPALANFVSALCFERAYAFAPSPPSGVGHPVEFVPVPGLPGDGGRRRGHHEGNGYARKLPPLRGGAGYELDLSDVRQHEHLPPELRPLLPDRGFVNLHEANAVVRLLEALVPATSAKSVAVLPLYAAQAVLIRALVQASPVLAGSSVALAVEPAATFRQRECDVAVIALTRSHTHRAVAYGDDPAAVPLALTRAGQRIIVVGDPGTLARRAQWDGPLDHLDGVTATRERAWVADLVRQLSGHGPASPIHLLEGPP